MEVEVIRHTVRPGEVATLRKEGCDKAKTGRQSIADIELSVVLIQQDIEKLKEKTSE